MTFADDITDPGFTHLEFMLFLAGRPNDTDVDYIYLRVSLWLFILSNLEGVQATKKNGRKDPLIKGPLSDDASAARRDKPTKPFKELRS